MHLRRHNYAQFDNISLSRQKKKDSDFIYILSDQYIAVKSLSID